MQPVKRRRALPVYIAATVFALYTMLFPLYALRHFLLAALVTAAAWLLADRLIQPVVEYIPEPEPEPVSHGAEADAVLAEAKTAAMEMEKLSASIGDPSITRKIAALIDLSNRIARDVLEDPADMKQVKKFQSYFLPSTLGLLHAYDRMGDAPGDKALRTKERISQILDTEIQAFQKQLDSLYDNDLLDIDADIRVMQMLLEREGLLENNDLHTALKQTPPNP